MQSRGNIAAFESWLDCSHSVMARKIFHSMPISFQTGVLLLAHFDLCWSPCKSQCAIQPQLTIIPKQLQLLEYGD